MPAPPSFGPRTTNPREHGQSWPVFLRQISSSRWLCPIGSLRFSFPRTLPGSGPFSTYNDYWVQQRSHRSAYFEMGPPASDDPIRVPLVAAERALALIHASARSATRPTGCVRSCVGRPPRWGREVQRPRWRA